MKTDVSIVSAGKCWITDYQNTDNSTAWQRRSSAAINLEPNSTIFYNRIRLPWYQALFL